MNSTLELLNQLKDLVPLLRDVGVLGMALIFVLGLARKWWVLGWVYREKEAEAAEWKTAALLGTGMAEKAVHHALHGRTS